jgi:hypothetical protein
MFVNSMPAVAFVSKTDVFSVEGIRFQMTHLKVVYSIMRFFADALVHNV